MDMCGFKGLDTRSVAVQRYFTLSVVVFGRVHGFLGGADLPNVDVDVVCFPFSFGRCFNFGLY